MSLTSLRTLQWFTHFYPRGSKSTQVILQRCTSWMSNDMSNSCQDVAQLCATGGAFAARTKEGVSWRHKTLHDSTTYRAIGGKPVLMEVGRRKSKHVRGLAESSAFAIEVVVTWGDENSGGDSLQVWDQLSAGVVDLCHTSGAFAARKSDGSVVF